MSRDHEWVLAIMLKKLLRGAFPTLSPRIGHKLAQTQKLQITDDYNTFKQSETTVTISRKLNGFISQRLPDFSRNSSVLGELVSPVMKIMLWASFGLISFTFS